MQGPVAIILAAGHGKRMRSGKAKVLHEVCGQPMLRYVVDAVRDAGAKTIVVVVGIGADQVQSYLADEPDILFAVQEQQLGTGHAVHACRSVLSGYSGPCLIVVGDEPLLRPEPLANLIQKQQAEKEACLLGTAMLPDPTGFGRILRDSTGRFIRIVEQRDCAPEEVAIREVNPSCYVFELPLLWDAIDRLTTNNAQHEYYLTDAPAILMEMGRKVAALTVLDADDVLGINTRRHLAEANMVMQNRIQHRLMSEGVTIIDPRNTYIDGRAEIRADTIIFPFTVIQGHVRVGEECRIGPFAHLRDGTVLGDGCEIGAFVEISRSELGEQVTAKHLSYLGHSMVGEGANIGAGAITANYDGRDKHVTQIGARAMIGSGAVLVAPVTIGEDAKVGANAVVSKGQDVAAGKTVAGVPARPLR